MFIRLKKRKTKSGCTKTYAYLVLSKHTSEGPRQKVKKYLGRVYALKKLSNSQILIKKTFQETVLQTAIQELKAHGFRSSKSKVVHFEGFIFDQKAKSFTDKNNVPIGLILNQGVFCGYTYARLIAIAGKHKERRRLGKELGKALIEAGLSVTPDEFLKIFNLLSEIPTTVNNDQQSSTMPNNAQQ